jgi:hypothetical protein
LVARVCSKLTTGDSYFNVRKECVIVSQTEGLIGFLNFGLLDRTSTKIVTAIKVRAHIKGNKKLNKAMAKKTALTASPSCPYAGGYVNFLKSNIMACQKAARRAITETEVGVMVILRGGTLPHPCLHINGLGWLGKHVRKP